MCIGLNDEHPYSFVDVKEGEFNAETGELFGVEMLPFLWMLLYSLLCSIYTNWLGVGADNMSLIYTPSGNPLFSLKYVLVEISSLFFV